MALLIENETNSDFHKTILEETFYVITRRNSVFRVKLTKAGLSLIKENDNQTKTQLVPIADIVGCRCLRRKQGNECVCNSLLNASSLRVVDDRSGDHDITDISAYLYIYAYIMRNRGKRERTTITLRFRTFDKYEENYKEAQRWRYALKKLLRGEEVLRSSVNDYNMVTYIKEDRRLLILLSPKSGAGKGRLLFQKKIVPMLQEAEIPYDLHITKHANYAREFVRTCNLFQWTGIVVVGGDGLVFEVVNGMFERLDWSEALKHITIGVVPGGSGNGLARSIAHSSSEPYSSPALPAALSIVRNNFEFMDLVRVETKSQILFSFLSVGWGLLSDIDIESEVLRMLGERRFTLWSVARLISLRTYSGKVFYLPANEISKQEKYTTNRAYQGDNKFELAPEINLESKNGRQRLDSWYSAASRKSDYFSTAGSSYQSTADSICDSTKHPDMYGPASQLPCLTASLLPNWKCLSGRFITVYASYQSHVGTDCVLAPKAQLNDGIIWLLIVHATASRLQLLQFLLGLNSGAHACSEENSGVFELLPVQAFRIEPNMDEQGYMTVDGESVEYGPIQAEVFPSVMKVMVP